MFAVPQAAEIGGVAGGNVRLSSDDWLGALLAYLGYDSPIEADFSAEPLLAAKLALEASGREAEIVELRTADPPFWERLRATDTLLVPRTALGVSDRCSCPFFVAISKDGTTDMLRITCPSRHIRGEMPASRLLDLHGPVLRLLRIGTR